jgi:hypothetical protein
VTLAFLGLQHLKSLLEGLQGLSGVRLTGKVSTAELFKGFAFCFRGLEQYRVRVLLARVLAALRNG